MFKFKKSKENKTVVEIDNNGCESVDKANMHHRWKNVVKRGCAGLVCVSLLLFASFANTKRIDNENAMTDFSSKVVNIGGYSITLKGNYSVSVWRSGNTVYCKASVYVTAPNGATQAMGASLNTNKANTSKQFVGYGGSTPKSGSGDLQISFSDSGSGTISGTIYAGFTGSLNGSQALSATFSVSYSSSKSDTLIYDANGGSGGPSNQSVNGNATISSTKPTRAGYDFKYWASIADWQQEGKTVRFNHSVIDRAFVHIIGNNKYEIMVHTNGSIGSVQVPIWTADGNQSDIVWHPLNMGSWTRDGQYYNWGAQITHHGELAGQYLIMHIYANNNGVEYGRIPQVFYSGGSYNYVSGTGTSTTLYAQWTPPHKYKVAYNGNGATGGSMSNSDHTYDTAKNLTTNGYTRNGYTFLGWSTSPNGSVQYSNGQSVKNLTATNGATVTLYAQWKQLGYEIDYDGNGADGGSTSTQYAPFNQTTTLNKNGYYKKGYKFKEWNSKANGSGESYKDQQSISVDGNKTVTKQ